MAWEAPNLLDRIFKTPDTGSGSTLGAFLGGYIAGADKKKAAAPVAKQAVMADDGAQSGADYGTPSNPEAPATTDPAATTVSAPPSNWFKDFAKSTLEGEQIGQNITAFEAAKTTDKVRQAQLVGEVLKNRGLQNALDYQTQDQGVLHQVMQETDPVKIGDAVMPELRTTQGRAAFLQWKASAAQTAAEEADKTVRTQDLTQFGILKKAGYDIDLEKLPNGELQPNKDQLKQASSDYDQVLQQRALANVKIAADAKIEAAREYGDTRRYVADAAADSRDHATDTKAQTARELETSRSADRRLNVAGKIYSSLRHSSAMDAIAFKQAVNDIEADTKTTPDQKAAAIKDAAKAFSYIDKDGVLADLAAAVTGKAGTNAGTGKFDYDPGTKQFVPRK